MGSKNGLVSLGLPREPLSIQEFGLFTYIRPGIARSDFADWVEEAYFEAMQDLHLAPFVQGV
jgi:hypothetical protein